MKLRVRPIFAWYDLWFGFYIDTKKRRLYCMVPLIDFYIELEANSQ